MGSRETSEPRVYPAPSQIVFDALVAGARQVALPVTGADPQQGVVWAEKPLSMMSWGEIITVHVRPEGPHQTSVVVESRLKFGLVAWGKHKANFQLVHRALDVGLAGAQQHGGRQQHGGQQHFAGQQSQPHGFPQQGQQHGQHAPQGQPNGFPQHGGQHAPQSQPHGLPQQGQQHGQQGHQQTW